MKLSKRILSVLLCVLIFLSATCFSVVARTIYVSGSWEYEKINDDKEIEIYAYTGSAETVSTYRSYNSLLITSVGSGAFKLNETLKKITLSSAVKTIKNDAFLNATALTTVVCKNNINTIEYSAFSGCTALSSINLEDTCITKVSYGSFFNCDSLTEIVLPDTVLSINENAFAYCDSLSKIMIPASVTEIADNAFYSTANVVIHCYRDSVAHVYAETNSIDYVLIDPEPTVPETQPTEPTEPTVPETLPTEPPRTYMLGDIDDDGEITVMDATRIQLILVELYKNYTEEDVIRGDVEKDGVLSIMDVTSIQRYSASFDDGLGIGETFEF